MEKFRRRRALFPPIRTTAGFTLLELLVGIALFALLSSVVLGGIRLGIRSWDAAAARSADNEQIRVVHHLLQRQLTGALAIAESSAGRWLLQFEGDSDSVRFVSEFPVYVANGGAQVVTLSAVAERGKKQLLLRWWPLHAADDVVPQDDAVLLRDFSKIEISYFGAAQRNALPQWRDNWQQLQHLPQLVKIVIAGSDGAYWPALIVPLKVNAPRFYKSRNPSLGGGGTADPKARDPES